MLPGSHECETLLRPGRARSHMEGTFFRDYGFTGRRKGKKPSKQESCKAHPGRKRDRPGRLSVTRGRENPSMRCKQAVSAELSTRL